MQCYGLKLILEFRKRNDGKRYIAGIQRYMQNYLWLTCFFNVIFLHFGNEH